VDNTSTSTLQHPVYLYQDPGVYQVSLQVEDGDGSIEELVIWLEVYDENAVDVPSLPPLGLGLLTMLLSAIALLKLGSTSAVSGQGKE
jgi:hypothetical protein